ncbi:MAG TPA: gephyrin-like molybdotransferase Glp [Acidimicrobiales bacterium]|nr:gephyrin-like molybdotransferase Glp [Acidimicrobiales bacterium]
MSTPSSGGLTPLHEAQALVLRSCHAFHPRTVPLGQAVGSVTSAPVTAQEHVPPFDNSAMDGFAVQAADTEAAPVALRVVGTLAAGAAPDVEVGPGEAVRIMTGAPMPPGADAVVMVECTSPGEGDTVVVEEAVAAGQSVRRAGDDVRPGDVVVGEGEVVTPGVIGVLASLGLVRVPTRRAPVVGVLSTGDELVDGGGVLGPGQIRDSNRPMLVALAGEAGCEVIDFGTVADDLDAITGVIREATSACDVLVTSGGVSVGDFDLIREVLDRLGEMVWMQVAIKPAKPFAFGLVQGTPVFGLPGNPVSSMVSFELFARPALRRMIGHPDDRLHRPRVRAFAEHDILRRPDGKVHFVRLVATVGADGRHHVRSAGGQGSHQLSALAAANALGVLPDGTGVVAGGELDVVLLSEEVAGP